MQIIGLCVRALDWSGSAVRLSGAVKALGTLAAFGIRTCSAVLSSAGKRSGRVVVTEVALIPLLLAPDAAGRERMTVCIFVISAPPTSVPGGRDKPRQCNEDAEHRTPLPPRLGMIRPGCYPCPRHLPRRKSRALPFVDIQERGLPRWPSPTSIKDADSDPVPPRWPFMETRLAEIVPVSHRGYTAWPLTFTRFLVLSPHLPHFQPLKSRFHHPGTLWPKKSVHPN